MLPSVNLNVLDGALGVLPPGLGDIMAIVGPASDGPFDTPAAFAQTKYLTSNFKSGPAVEAACYAVEYTGKPVVFVRSQASTAGSYSALDNSKFTGTSVPSLDTATHPDDEYEVVLAIPRKRGARKSGEGFR